MHFFLDVDNLANQNQNDGFGPDTGNPSNIYNVSSRFQLNNNAKAFACVNGYIIVQQSSKDPALVNVILNPLNPLNETTQVEYYIYRGILKNSLISGVNIAQAGNELTNRFYDQSPTEVGANFLGFSNISGDTNVKDLFDQNVPNVYTMPILEGEWFGDFGHSIVVGGNNENYKIGFETILESERLQIDLNYLRQHNAQIDVTGLNDFQTRVKRDNIISYIDPVAFFGLFYNSGINTSTFPGGVKNTVRKNKTILYNEVLNKFSTKNKVYLDIRSEKGYSYNFYINYGDPITNNNIQLGYRGSAPSPQEYHTNNWPIISIEAPQSSGTFNTIRFKLRIDDNRVPIIFLPNKNILSKPKSSFIVTETILDGGATDWSEEITFQFPNIVNGSNRDNYPYYIRIYYYRQYNDNPVPQTVLDYNSFYNGAFCPIDFVGKTFRSSFPSFIREKINDDGTGNFAYLASNGAYLDDSRVVFYANSKIQEKILRSEKQYLPTYYTDQLQIDNADFNDASINCNLYTIKRDYPIGQTTKRIPGINAYKDNAGILQEKEDALLLGLTIAELDTLRNTTGLDLTHDRYIYLHPHPNNPRTDNGGLRYMQFTVQLQGLDNNGNSHKVSTPLVVYSRDKMFFSTEAFGAIEEITEGENRIEFHIYHNNCIKINDNIDLSLLSGEGLTYNQVILNSTQELVQNLYYIYIDENNIRQNVCGLIGVQINKVGKGVLQNHLLRNAQPPAGVQTFLHDSSNGVDAYLTWIYENGNIVTFGKAAKNYANNYSKLYANTGKKTFLVMFNDTEILNSDVLNFNFIDSPNSATRRYYFGQTQAAAVLGGLIKFHNVYNNISLDSGGASFPTGGCFPSNTHASGLAWDLSYINLVSGQSYPPATYAADKRIIDEMENFGFGNNNETYVGENATFNYLVQNTIAVSYPKHNDHIHFGGFILNNNCDDQ